MNKNQWSLKAYTQKDISKRIMNIQEMPHSEEEFNMLLSQKEDYEKERPNRPQQMLKVLNCKVKKREEQSSNLCSSCYEEMNGSKHWCKICGNSTCRRCLVRQRELKDESKAHFCEKCDQEYLRAMDGITHYNQTQILEQTLAKLIQEQENIEALVVQERQKCLVNGEDPSELVSKGAAIEKLQEQNKILKIRNAQLSKKVQFGKNISKDLRRKYKGLKKQQGQSFGTVSNNQSQDMMLENRQDDLDMSMDHRQSILTAATDFPLPEEDFRKKCTCDIY